MNEANTALEIHVGAVAKMKCCGVVDFCWYYQTHPADMHYEILESTYCSLIGWLCGSRYTVCSSTGVAGGHSCIGGAGVYKNCARACVVSQPSTAEWIGVQQ